MSDTSPTTVSLSPDAEHKRQLDCDIFRAKLAMELGRAMNALTEEVASGKLPEGNLIDTAVMRGAHVVLQALDGSPEDSGSGYFVIPRRDGTTVLPNPDAESWNDLQDPDVKAHGIDIAGELALLFNEPTDA